MSKESFDIIVIGGSSGSISVVADMLNTLPAGFIVPIVVVIHRMKNVESDLKTVLCPRRPLVEPDDKEQLREGVVYLAPQNYHLLVEQDGTFSVDYSELVNYSRPAIDVTFASVAAAYGGRAMAIVLSGANTDGATGIKEIMKHGGMGIVQDPASAEYPFMPEAAIKANPGIEVHTPQKIVDIMMSQAG